MKPETTVPFPEDTLPLIQRALDEDLGPEGDLTSRFFVPDTQQATALIVARESLTLSGLRVAAEVFRQVDPELRIDMPATDGAMAERGETVLRATGRTRSLLSAERTALNFLQRLSGIATMTKHYVQALGPDTKTRLLDTRKTTPGWRRLEKAAVLAGGGHNHRVGLFDAVMVKDNHLLAESSPQSIAHSIRELRLKHPDIKVELEVDTLSQLADYLELDGVDVILLDNMSCDELREAVAFRDTRAASVKLEASGGITLDTLPDIGTTGVDFVSVGALTHSAVAVDLAMELDVLS